MCQASGTGRRQIDSTYGGGVYHSGGLGRGRGEGFGLLVSSFWWGAGGVGRVWSCWFLVFGGEPGAWGGFYRRAGRERRLPPGGFLVFGGEHGGKGRGCDPPRGGPGTLRGTSKKRGQASSGGEPLDGVEEGEGRGWRSRPRFEVTTGEGFPSAHWHLNDPRPVIGYGAGGSSRGQAREQWGPQGALGSG